MRATLKQWLEFVFNIPVREREWYWNEDFDHSWAALGLTDAHRSIYDSAIPALSVVKFILTRSSGTGPIHRLK
jgi:hypothetical protein